MPFHLALYQPDIAQNTGTLLRLGACLGIRVHVIHPTGFPFSRSALRRSGMDYLDRVDMVEHPGFAAFEAWRRGEGRRLVLLTTRAAIPHHRAGFEPNDIVMVGRESAGVPDAVAEAADLRLRIPMAAGARSLNVAISAAMVLERAMEQTGAFDALG